jgi:hypothetical protein
MRAGQPKECIEMYNKSGKWEHAFKVIIRLLSGKKINIKQKIFEKKISNKKLRLPQLI